MLPHVFLNNFDDTGGVIRSKHNGNLKSAIFGGSGGGSFRRDIYGTEPPPEPRKLPILVFLLNNPL